MPSRDRGAALCCSGLTAGVSCPDRHRQQPLNLNKSARVLPGAKRRANFAIALANLKQLQAACMHLPEDPETPPQINIVPMIDVIFVVLTFFILSSLFLTRAEGLPVNLPSADTSENQLEQHTLTLTITSAGDLQLGNEPATLDSLPEQIQARRIGDRPLLIVLRADREAAHGQVVEVMDRLRLIENLELAIATSGGAAPQ